MNLGKEEILRFSRQLLLPEIGPSGQMKLLRSSVLIVGLGGLGSPVALYLAAAGINKLGLVDFDTVESNNLHRQIIHSEKTIGQPKVVSAANSIKSINSACEVSLYPTSLISSNAMEIVRPYDVVVDASDNVATRYLVNDACVLLNKPLVSGSALKFDGQLTTYIYGKAPCYRCLFPKPPPADTVTNCNDGGVLGPIVGTIGSLQALEVIKCITGIPSYAGKMLIFDGLIGEFKTIKLRSKKENCDICGSKPSITSLIDYKLFCGSDINDKAEVPKSVLSNSHRISCKEYKENYFDEDNHVLIDVRNEQQFKLGSLPDAINIHYLDLGKHLDTLREYHNNGKEIIFVCRRGNTSQTAVKVATEAGIPAKDIIGGLTTWAAEIDPSFPIY